MRRYHREYYWTKCPCCGGTGRADKIEPTYLAVLRFTSAAVMARLVQGICSTCKGKGQIRLEQKTFDGRVGFFEWLWKAIFWERK